MKHIKHFILPLLLVGVSCVKTELDDVSDAETITTKETDELAMNELKIPVGFDFATAQNIQLNITDVMDGAMYEIYQYQQDNQSIGDKLFKGTVKNGKIAGNFSLPADATYVEFKRFGEELTRKVIAVNGTSLDYNHN